MLNWCPRCGRKLDQEDQCVEECREERQRTGAKAMRSIRMPARVAAIAPTEVKLSRQQLRRIGRAKTVSEVSIAAPLLSRQQRRQEARSAHLAAWAKRDVDLVRKFYKGFIPEPKPLAIDVSKTSQ